MAMACSAVVMTLPAGVFITMMPRLVAAGISTLSSPMPARPTTLRRRAVFSRSSVTFVALRMISASYSPMIAWSSSGFSPARTSTWISGSLRKRSRPTSSRLSLTRTFIIVAS